MNQKSYEKNEFGNLYLIPTPIGNLKDITFRAIEILENVDIIYAEDTRQTKILLSNYNINKKIESCHKYSEMKHKDKIMSILKEGKNIAYVTDRGTPLISDPGNVIVNSAIENNYNVIALPGPNALLPALNMSGLDNDKFLFYGFLNNKNSIQKKELKDVSNIKATLIFYESPYRLKDTLKNMLEVLGDRKCAVVREISKIYEEVIRNNISDIIEICDNIKGEFVIVVEGAKEEKKEEFQQYEKEVLELVKGGLSKRDAIKEVSKRNNISKNELYNKLK